MTYNWLRHRTNKRRNTFLRANVSLLSTLAFAYQQHQQGVMGPDNHPLLWKTKL